jgi:hypothetical protein
MYLEILNMPFSMVSRSSLGLVFCLFSAFSAFGDMPHEDSEAMELGGLLTVDGANKFKDWENTPAQLGSVELSANVNVEANMQGSITLLSEGDPNKIVVDQAVGQWTLSQGKVIFGQQGFNLGLLSTRTISDPLMLDLGEFKQAGVTLLWIQNAMTYGFGLTSLETMGPDSAAIHDPCVVLNVDFAPEGQMHRLGLQASRKRVAVDAALNHTLATWLFDLEGVWRFKDEDGMAKGGYSAGIAWQVNSWVQPALRWDALGNEEKAVDMQQFTVGITVTPVEHVFGAGEISWDQDGEPSFAVQMGLQSTLKLPGFQRRTLTK